MAQFKYFKCDFVPVDNIHNWLLEYKDNQITREIGLDKNGMALLALPNIEYPRGLFGDSNIYMDFSDLIEITREEFELKWNEVNANGAQNL